MEGLHFTSLHLQSENDLIPNSYLYTFIPLYHISLFPYFLIPLFPYFLYTFIPSTSQNHD